MRNGLGNEHTVQNLLSFTVPLMLSGLFQQLFNWVDAFIVGNTEGELALAGIGATTSVYNLFVTVITGFTAGLSVCAAQKFGERDRKTVSELLSAFALTLTLLFGAVSIAGMAFTDRILILLSTPADIFSNAESYLRILFTGIPFLALYNTYSAILRSTGNSRAPFLSVLVSSAANVILDVILVAVLRYGTAGAAIATVAAQISMTVFIVGYTAVKYPYLKFSFHPRMLRGTSLRQGTVFGLPPAVQSGISSVGNLYLQQFMNGFGEQTVAAITTAYRVDTVIFLPIINFSSGIATLTAQKTGAGNNQEARKIFRTGTWIMILISFGLTGLVLLSGEYLIAAFGLSEQSIAIGKSFFYSIAVFYPVYGLAMAIRGYLEGKGRMLFSGIVGILSLGVRIVCSFTFKPVLGRSVIAYAEAFSWIFMLIVYSMYFLLQNRKERLADLDIHSE